jgi:[ribosomal protein S5]-alanine N-acetyltransferase
MRLRHVKKSDAADYYTCHDKEAKKNFWSSPKSLEEAKKDIKGFIRQYKLPTSKRKEEFFVIEHNGAFAGWISLHDIRYQHRAVTGSLIMSKFRGKGLGTLSHKRLLTYAFKTYKLKRIVGKTRTFNKASARMLEKAGYKLEGILKKDHYQNGKYYDNYLYAQTKQ